jgi:hypothetical protein
MTTPESPSELSWSVNPYREDPWKGISALVVIAASIWFTLRLGGPLLGLLAVLILVGGVGPFFVTTRYRLTEAGVEVRGPFQKVSRPWKDFRRAYRARNGVSLSPFAGRHLLEPYRSVMLRFGNHREEVLDWVTRLGPPLGSPGKDGT